MDQLFRSLKYNSLTINRRDGSIDGDDGDNNDNVAKRHMS